MPAAISHSDQIGDNVTNQSNVTKALTGEVSDLAAKTHDEFSNINEGSWKMVVPQFGCEDVSCSAI